MAEQSPGRGIRRAKGSAPKLSIIIATYNARDLLADCLESIHTHPPEASFETIVVDDASEDQTETMVRNRFPQVRCLRNPINVNYGRSNNRAIDVAAGSYIYLLNNDTIMRPGALDLMLAFLEAHPEAGAVGSRLLNADGSTQWSVKTLPNPVSALFGARSVVTQLFPGNSLSRRHLLHPADQACEPYTAGYVSSASMMIPRDVIDRVGYLDERLNYHVDADYCKRIADAGWLIYCLPSATVVHLAHKGGTMVSRRRRFKSVVEFHLCSYLYYRKHLMRSTWSAMHLVVILGLGGRFVVSLVLWAGRELMAELRKRVRPGNSPPVGGVETG